uniref:Uncharacterized protein n=1 Tax=Candidatus Kentrum sp. UNK TaxID=2126344 RepID=A0A451B2Y5_9GAMM|nr:MAG: hypothetical protein BECKUNK1418G_GA0071005_11352 [Candidatus Kentron sp. UNK]VFK72654.1 MAG: hypothetical protein BECKUNK1418H_GA0071006_11289 [Candidatus Kentron sp. UNK]
MAGTRFCYHPWQLDSANPWRNDGSGFNVTIMLRVSSPQQMKNVLA